MGSNFWRYYRLVFSQRWWIFALMAIAGGVIIVGTFLLGQKQTYEAVALIEPQTEELRNLTSVGENDKDRNRREDDLNRISDLIMLLRSSNDLYLRAAKLLKMNEEDRGREVDRILEKNGFYAPFFAEIDSQTTRKIAAKELTQVEADKGRLEARTRIREQVINSFARSSDEAGAFGAGGLSLTEDEITELIRKKMSFDTVDGPMSKEDSRQIVNQIKISGIFERAAESELYVNALCVAFIDFYTGKSMGVLNARIAQLEDKRDQARKGLDLARGQMVQFQNTRRITLTMAQEAAIGNSVNAERQRDEVKQRLSQAQASVASLAIAVADARKNPTNRIKLNADENPLVAALEKNYYEAKFAFDRIKNSNLGPGSSEWIQAEMNMKDAKKDLDDAKKRDFGSTQINVNRYELEQQFEAAKAQRDGFQQQLVELERQVAEQSKLVAGLPAAQARLADLRQKVATAEKYFNSLEDQLTGIQTQAIGQSRAGVISIVSQAHATLIGGDMVSQRWKLMFYGIALALIFGIALVIGLDTLDNSIQTTQDVEELLGLPVVGVIPAQLPDPARASRIAYLDPLSPVAESYRLMRTDLLFTFEEKRQQTGQFIQSLMVATGKPGQGATTTISNLAITLAQSGKRVILVDADLRYSKLHNAFNISNKVGLTSVLEDRATLEDALQQTEIANLQLLPGGPVSLNPSELLGSERMRWLHEQLKSLADYVLFDTPSAIVFSDAAILSSIMDTTLMVVRASNIPRGAEDRVRRLLGKARANIIGVVLNAVPAEKVDSVHYHQSYYPEILRMTRGEPPRSLPGSNGTHSPSDVPLALPGVTDVGGTARASEAGTVGTLTKVAPRPATNGSGLPDYVEQYAQPVDRTRTPVLRKIPWKALGGVVMGGIVIGVLVLLLASGTTVR